MIIFSLFNNIHETYIFFIQGLNISDPLLRGRQSYFSLRATNIRAHTSASISLKPRSLNGLIFLAKSAFPGGDFLSLVMNNGTFTLTYRLGKSIFNFILRYAVIL